MKEKDKAVHFRHFLTLPAAPLPTLDDDDHKSDRKFTT